jgi:hypothetical protein
MTDIYIRFERDLDFPIQNWQRRDLSICVDAVAHAFRLDPILNYTALKTIFWEVNDSDMDAESLAWKNSILNLGQVYMGGSIGFSGSFPDIGDFNWDDQPSETSGPKRVCMLFCMVRSILGTTLAYLRAGYISFLCSQRSGWYANITPLLHRYSCGCRCI